MSGHSYVYIPIICLEYIIVNIHLNDYSSVLYHCKTLLEVRTETLYSKKPEEYPIPKNRQTENT
jgi:hypothetical protein